MKLCLSFGILKTVILVKSGMRSAVSSESGFTLWAFNPRPFSVFRHLLQCRGGGVGETPGVSKLSVIELRGKTSELLSTSTRDW